MMSASVTVSTNLDSGQIHERWQTCTVTDPSQQSSGQIYFTSIGKVRTVSNISNTIEIHMNNIKSTRSCMLTGSSNSDIADC